MHALQVAQERLIAYTASPALGDWFCWLHKRARRLFSSRAGKSSGYGPAAKSSRGSSPQVRWLPRSDRPPRRSARSGLSEPALARSFATLSATSVRHARHRFVSRAQVAGPRSDLRAVASAHLWHSNAKLRCELVTRDTSDTASSMELEARVIRIFFVHPGECPSSANCQPGRLPR